MTTDLNVLPQKKPVSVFTLYFSQLKSPLIYILLIASIITIYLKDYLDSIVILSAVVINSALGFIQEYKAQKTLENLKNLLSEKARIEKNGKIEEIDSKNLIVGNIIHLLPGDKVPADGILSNCVKLQINESILTGESLPVIKNINDKVFSGTNVVSGRGVALVEKIGINTEIGKIAAELQSEHEDKTPLQKKLDRFAKSLAIIVISLSLIVLIVGLIKKEDPLGIFTTSIAIAVSAIPEGLAVSLTAILAVGMQRILKRKAIVRKLISAETLGSVTVIATDKTGTLTEGQMKITAETLIDKETALKTAVLANNLETPIEVAIWEWARIQGIDPDKLSDSMVRSDEIPFSPETKLMAVKIGNTVYIKGAPEIIFEKCLLSENDKKNLIKTLDNYTNQGLHTIAFAAGTAPDLNENSLNNLSFLGILGAEDPIRESAKDAIKNCQKASVKTIVITGDYQKTAEFVLKKLGIEITDPATEIITGRELEEISERNLNEKINKIKLFARVSPHQKLKIVRALQKNKEVVAVTGDGVNDALALKEANIGIVVDSATSVAKDTADMVLLDSNFATIVAAIEEGRGIYDNIKRVTLYLVSDSFSEIIIILGSLLIGLPLPLTAAQILWINIIGDGLPNLALTIEPKSRNLLNRPPVDHRGSLLNTQMKSLIFIISAVSGLFALLLFIYTYRTTENLVYARTMSFTLHAVDSLIYVFAARALTKPIYKVNPFKNPALILAVVIGFMLQFVVIYSPSFSSAFQTTPLSISNWLLIMFLSAIVIISIEATKKVFSLSRVFQHNINDHH